VISGGNVLFANPNINHYLAEPAHRPLDGVVMWQPHTREVDMPKITALPILAGAYGFSFFADASYAFPIGLTLVMLMLVGTKQVKLI
jgi:hypothetical protein